MSFVEGHIVRDERAVGRADQEAARPRPAIAHRHTGPAPRRRRGRGRPRRLRPAGGVHRPAAQAVARSVHPVDAGRRPGSGRRRPGPRPARRPDPRPTGRRPSSTVTTGWTTPCSTTTATCSAILDWEICTLGDPLADLGLLLVYWAEPEDGALADRRGPDHPARLLPPGRAAGPLRAR